MSPGSCSISEEQYSGYLPFPFLHSPTWLSQSLAPLSRGLQVCKLGKTQVRNTTSPSAHRRRIRFALTRFLSPLLTGSRLISLPADTKMLQFSASLFLSECPEGQDFPLRDSGIKVCMRLPQAFRSLPRPSSVPKPNHPSSRVFDLCFSNRDHSND